MAGEVWLKRDQDQMTSPREAAINIAAEALNFAGSILSTATSLDRSSIPAFVKSVFRQFPLLLDTVSLALQSVVAFITLQYQRGKPVRKLWVRQSPAVDSSAGRESLLPG